MEKYTKDTTILSNGTEIPTDQLADYHRMSAEAAEKERMAAAERARTQLQKYCPFSQAVHPVCRGETCALYTARGCGLACLFDRDPEIPTTGKTCPITRNQCTTNCALAKNGACVFTTNPHT